MVAKMFSLLKIRRDRRHLVARKDTVPLLNLFRDTLHTLNEANVTGEDAIDLLDRKIRWHQLLRVKIDLETLTRKTDIDPLAGAAERSEVVRRSARTISLFFRHATTSI
ncbi:hypothetical protein QT231_14285 [Halomonas sp. SpR1]|uniref:hypothetical protein n=1 Tax=Halomonas sp. SpR1 TaxID=3050462 RepID=UPI0027E49598|nr:hypothetical protein [Halomonas sp. SpR1]MDQ7733877.1 hypothetical protein [Halomonas sp. SpR1]